MSDRFEDAYEFIGAVLILMTLGSFPAFFINIAKSKEIERCYKMEMTIKECDQINDWDFVRTQRDLENDR